MLFVPWVTVKILKEENIRVMLPSLHVSIQLRVMILREVDRQFHLNLGKAFGEHGSHSVPLCLSLNGMLAFIAGVDAVLHTIAARGYDKRTRLLLSCFVDLIECAGVCMQCGNHLDVLISKERLFGQSVECGKEL